MLHRTVTKYSMYRKKFSPTLGPHTEFAWKQQCDFIPFTSVSQLRMRKAGSGVGGEKVHICTSLPWTSQMRNFREEARLPSVLFMRGNINGQHSKQCRGRGEWTPKCSFVILDFHSIPPPWSITHKALEGLLLKIDWKYLFTSNVILKDGTKRPHPVATPSYLVPCLQYETWCTKSNVITYKEVFILPFGKKAFCGCTL